MAAQLIELLVFAAIAFLVISKLIATLGSTSSDEQPKQNSYFGENTSLKDVTHSIRKPNNQAEKAAPPKTVNLETLKGLIVEENQTLVLKGLAEVIGYLPQFQPSNFLRNTKSAFKMILEASGPDLAQLVDKRYLEQSATIIASYGQLANLANLEAKISEIYMFGNNILIKILFAGSNVTTAIEYLTEEWTFSRNLRHSGSDWYLTNIDRPH